MIPKFLGFAALPLGMLAASASANSAALVEPPIKALETHSIAPDFANPATEILDLEEERHRRMTIPVTIEGAGPYNFLIDTGSQATAVTQRINDSLSLLPIGRAQLVGMASIRPVDVVEVNNLVVGSHTIHSINAPVLNHNHVGADGIIGLDSLQDFRVLIDFRNETIALEDLTMKQTRSGFEIVVKARQKLGQLLITDALVEGVRATVIIDTGAQSSLANNALRNRLRSKRSQEVTTTDVNGVSMVGDSVNIRSLTIEGMTMANMPLTFADAPAFEALGLKDTPTLSLGMQHLKMFDRVAIDFSNQRILFDVPRDAARKLRKAKQSRLASPLSR